MSSLLADVISIAAGYFIIFPVDQNVTVREYDLVLGATMYYSKLAS